MDLQAFTEALAGMSDADVAELVSKETGHRPAGRTRDVLVANAFAIYTAHAAGEEIPEAAVAAPAEPPPAAPAPAPEPAKPARGKAKAKPAAAASAPVKPAAPEYEGRSRTGRTFHDSGRVFLTRWEPLGCLTDAELERFASRSQFIQIRVREL